MAEKHTLHEAAHDYGTHPVEEGPWLNRLVADGILALEVLLASWAEFQRRYGA